MSVKTRQNERKGRENDGRKHACDTEAGCVVPELFFNTLPDSFFY